MPDETLWETSFSPEEILRMLGLDRSVRDAVEFGCAYGTFTIPAAKIVSGTLSAIETDQEMIGRVREKAKLAEARNIRCLLRDFITEGSGLGTGSVDYAMLCNVLPDMWPERLIREAFRIVRPGGRIGIIHWYYESRTMRGTFVETGLRPGQVRQWADEAGFRLLRSCDLRPYHYGFVLEKPGEM